MYPLVVASPSVASSTFDANKTLPPWVVMDVADVFVMCVLDQILKLFAVLLVMLALKMTLSA